MSEIINYTSTVLNTVQAFTEEGKVFTAYDVTKKVNEDGQIARHYMIKNLVHSLFVTDDMGDANKGYDRQLVTLNLGDDDMNAFVYFPNDKTAYDHPLAKKTTVPVLDLDSAKDDTEDDDDDEILQVKVKVTKEKRINIPQSILDKVVPIKDIYKVYIDCYGWGTVTKNKDGRARISVSNICHAGDEVTVISGDNNKTIIIR